MCINQSTSLESLRTHLEKVMMDLPPERTVQEKKMYLAGAIDTLSDLDFITEEMHGILYSEFVG